jgi:hypothetical protein
VVIYRSFETTCRSRQQAVPEEGLQSRTQYLYRHNSQLPHSVDCKDAKFAVFVFNCRTASSGIYGNKVFNIKDKKVRGGGRLRCVLLWARRSCEVFYSLSVVRLRYGTPWDVDCQESGGSAAVGRTGCHKAVRISRKLVHYSTERPARCNLRLAARPAQLLSVCGAVPFASTYVWRLR